MPQLFFTSPKHLSLWDKLRLFFKPKRYGFDFDNQNGCTVCITKQMDGNIFMISLTHRPVVDGIVTYEP